MHVLISVVALYLFVKNFFSRLKKLIIQGASKFLRYKLFEITFTPVYGFKSNFQHNWIILLFSTKCNQLYKWQPITDSTDPILFTNLIAKILSGDIVLSGLILIIMKKKKHFHDYIMSAYYQCNPDPIDTLHTDAGFNKD